MALRRRILVMAFSTGIVAGLASTLSIDWMRYLMVVLIGIVAALFWQLNEVREDAEKRVVRAVSHHMNNSLSIVMNRQHLDPSRREQIVDQQLLRCAWAIQTILPALNVGVRDLLALRRQPHQNEWAFPDIESVKQNPPPIVH